MEQQEIQLYSDIIKIGFPVIGTICGAIIGGVSTFFLTKLNQTNEVKNEIRKTRNELLIEIANDVSEYEDVASAYSAEISNKVRGINGLKEIDEYEQQLNDKTGLIRRTKVKLKLLSLHDAEKSLDEYIDIVGEFYIKGEQHDPNDVENMQATIRRGPISFYKILGEEFASNNGN